MGRSPKQLRLLLLIIVSITYTSVAIFILFYELMQLSEIYLLSLFGVLTILSSIYAVYRLEILRRRVSYVTVGESYPIVFEKAAKSIQIQNSSGDASIRYFFTIKNTSREALKRLSFNYSYDGELEKVEVRFNRERIRAMVEELTTHKRIGNTLEPISSLPNLMRVAIDLCEENIQPGQSFVYEILMNVKRCYDLSKKEFTSFHVNAPTKLFAITLLAPPECIIEETDYSVQNRYEVADVQEKERIEIERVPRQLAYGKGIVWSVRNPKLASSYNLYFRTAKRR